MLNKGPDSPFIHKQTLVSGVRFTTVELADLDSKIASAAERVTALEVAVFGHFVERLAEQVDTIREMARALSRLDVQAAWAVWASENKAVRPVITDGPDFKIIGGRHPVVEEALRKSGAAGFTANDCTLSADGKTAPRLTLITGPNMAGKSTYLRQNALMFILAQSGGFVPAAKAEIGAADRLFSRVGASDDLSKGRSTFMTEMIETAAILNQATPRSFVILDEIGRGTSTFDGLSIAWEVAKLAGLPAAAVARAREVLDKLEHESVNTASAPTGLPLFSAAASAPPPPSELDQALYRLDVDTLSPRQALDLLYDLNRKAQDKIGRG